ncbi:MAG: acyltransferase [Elusimicrobiota bacterium]
MTQTPSKAIQHDAGLDGLRGLAILLVVGQHYLPHGISFDPTGGRLGADVFFVLSGYLITRSLRPLAEAPRESWRELLAVFYQRRFRRILPLFLITVLLAALFRLEELRHLPWHLSFLSNWHFIREGRFSSPGGPLWFVAVIMQFYLIWPWVIRWAGWPRLKTVSLVLVALGLLIRTIGGFFDWPKIALDIMTPGAFETFGAGALLAAWRNRKSIELFGLGGLGLIFLRQVFAGSLFGNGFSLMTTELSRALILLWVTDRVLNERADGFQSFLSWRPLVELGHRSFGIYLSHAYWLTAAFRYSEGNVSRILAFSLTLVWAGVALQGTDTVFETRCWRRQRASKRPES